MQCSEEDCHNEAPLDDDGRPKYFVVCFAEDDDALIFEDRHDPIRPICYECAMEERLQGDAWRNKRAEAITAGYGKGYGLTQDVRQTPPDYSL